MTRDDWLNEFPKKLVVLRPHLGTQFARSVALVSHGALGDDYDPTKAAPEYPMRREEGAPRPLRLKKRLT